MQKLMEKLAGVAEERNGSAEAVSDEADGAE